LNHLRVYWLTCVLLMAAVAASATTIVLPTDDQLIAKSPVIVAATVVSSAPVLLNGKIWTETVLSVDQSIKGGLSGNVIVREVGGVLGDRITKIFGAPQYVAGERVMAFLTPTPRGDYQTTDMYVGKFTERQTIAGERIWQRDDANADVALLDSGFKPLATHNLQRRADAFEQFVKARAANKSGDANYGIENPVLQQKPTTRNNSTGLAVSDNFTLISEPTVYRWSAFDRGQTANWYSQGSQTGYTGGGVNEISQAMSAWTGYTSASIKYNYAGTYSGGSLQPLNINDNINGILFNDPYQEISGTYNPSTGGVVGVGGFNGVSGTQQWTATFTADGTHVAGTYNATSITEAGLTIQDGVTPSAGISSSLLAQIVAHEFGHTLGFGHSSDSTALMYPTVNGGGPTLRTDDQLAARWLYPNGSSPTPTPTPTPTVPAAPSNLTATPSSTTVALHWTDNAGGNETGEYIYYADATGSFTRVGSVGAGSTSANLNGFTAGLTYRFYVTSFNSAGESPASNVASATIAGSNPPPTPTPAPVAAFVVSPSNGIAAQTVFVFTNQSSGSITSVSWNFGDGATSTATAPTHTYGFAGQYTITLSVTGSGGTSSVQHAVSVANPAPAVPPVAAAFDFAPNAPTTADTVQFNDRSSGSPTSWNWSFGDGSSSFQQNPQHRYAAPGTYVVSMTASNGVSSAQSTQSVTVAAVAPYRSLVSATAQTNGVGGSVWRTELTILNAGSESAYGQLILLPGAGGAMQSRPLFLAPRQSVTYQNALLDIYGLSSGVGAIAIEANSAASTPNLKITSRTYTTSNDGGTYGQAVPEVGSSDLQTTLFVTGIESDASYRTNIGLVNRSDSPVTAELTLFTANAGIITGTITVNVPANNFSQGTLASYFPEINGNALSGLTLRVTSSAAGALSAYASVIDNRTQDPVYIQASPLRGGSDVVIPAIGRSGGANGTFWRSDVTLYNPTGTTQSYALRYLAANSDNSNPLTRSISLGAGHTVVLADILQNTFGLSGGTGSLSIAFGGGTAPIVTSRTYTSVATGGTFGQSIDPVETFGTDAWVPGLRSDFAFRSNVGFVNSSSTTIGATLQLIASNGQTLATGFVSLAPHSMTQGSVANFFPGIDLGSLGSFTLQAHSDNGSLFAYGSIVDNASGDPVFYAGQ